MLRDYVTNVNSLIRFHKGQLGTNNVHNISHIVLFVEAATVEADCSNRIPTETITRC